MFIDKCMIKITKNISGKESYVHYIKRAIKNSGLSKGKNAYRYGDFVVSSQPNKNNITNQICINLGAILELGRILPG